MRKRRHFRDDFKKAVLLEIEAGKLSIDKVVDQEGKQIRPLIVERWKDQVRVDGIGSNYGKVSKAIFEQEKALLLQEIGRLTLENRKLENLKQKKFNPTLSMGMTI